MYSIEHLFGRNDGLDDDPLLAGESVLADPADEALTSFYGTSDVVSTGLGLVTAINAAQEEYGHWSFGELATIYSEQTGQEPDSVKSLVNRWTVPYYERKMPLDDLFAKKAFDVASFKSDNITDILRGRYVKALGDGAYVLSIDGKEFWVYNGSCYPLLERLGAAYNWHVRLVPFPRSSQPRAYVRHFPDGLGNAFRGRDVLEGYL